MSSSFLIADKGRMKEIMIPWDTVSWTQVHSLIVGSELCNQMCKLTEQKASRITGKTELESKGRNHKNAEVDTVMN